MAKFQLDSDLVSDNHKTREAAVAVQTRRYQRRALDPMRLAITPRTPKCFKSFHSRSVRFSLTA